MLQSRGQLKRILTSPAATALGLFLLLVLTATACKKGAPTGADLAEDVGATISVRVFNSGVAQNGIAVKATDPAGQVTNGQTSATGSLSFSAKRPGNWTLTVPTQGNFYQSSATVTVNETQTQVSLTFSAEGQILIVSPLTVETYGALGGEVRYLIQYLQPGNLTLPVSLVVAPQGGPWPASWDTSFTPEKVGDTGDLSNFVVSIPSGSTQEPQFQIEARRADGLPALQSAAITVRRTFRIRTTLYVENHYEGSSVGQHFDGYLHFEPEIGSAGTQWILDMNIGLANSAAATTFSTSYGCISYADPICIQNQVDSGRGWNLLGLPRTCMTGSTQCGNVPRGQQDFWFLPGAQIPVTIWYDDQDLLYPRFQTHWTSGVADLTQDFTIPVQCQDVPVPGVYTLTQ